MSAIEGKVAQLLTDRDLVINKGKVNGVEIGMKFRILNASGSEVVDPDTGESLGVVDLTKVSVEVVTVHERFSVCSTYRQVLVPGRKGTPGLHTTYSSLSSSIFGDPGTPDTKRFETLRSTEPFVANEIDPAESYVKVGDRAVQIVRRAALEE